MEVSCPHCKTKYEVTNKELYRYSKCAICGKGFIVGTASMPQTTTKINNPAIPDKATVNLCFWSGMFLWWFGLVIAVVIGKTAGVLKAAKGMIAGIFATGSLACFVYAMSFLRKAHIFHSNSGATYAEQQAVMSEFMAANGYKLSYAPGAFEQYFNTKCFSWTIFALALLIIAGFIVLDEFGIRFDNIDKSKEG